MRLFVALRYRPFALLWLGRTISSLGDGVFLVALAWFVLTTTGSASANGVILICETVPMLLLTLIGGALVDRVSRRSLLLTSDIVRNVVYRRQRPRDARQPLALSGDADEQLDQVRRRPPARHASQPTGGARSALLGYGRLRVGLGGRRSSLEARAV